MHFFVYNLQFLHIIRERLYALDVLFLMYCFYGNCFEGEFFSSVKVIGKKFTVWIGLTFFYPMGRADA